MPCTEHETPIHDYLDDELAPVERARFEEHLSTCPNCQQEVAGARSLFAALEGLQPVQEPAGFKEGVMAGLPRRPPLHLGRWILAGQMVGTAALLVLAYPLLASWYQRIGRWLAPGWLCHLLADAAARGRDAWASLLSTYTVSIDLTWPKGLGLTWPQAALLTLVLVGLWWLGNRLLLVTEANRNGGTT